MDDPNDDLNRETNEVVGAVNASRDAIIGALRARDGVFPITANVQQTHVRLVAKRLVFSVSMAAVVTFMFGEQAYVYETTSALIVDLPAPITVVDRGKDISVAVSAGVVRIAYLTYQPE